MPKNFLPIFEGDPDIQWVSTGTAANTAKDGTGTVATAYTAPTDGGYVSELRCKQAAASVATVLRVFLNNGSTNATATNNSLIAEQTLPAITLSETAAQPDIVVPLGTRIPAGYKINVTIGTAIANAWQVTAFGAKLSPVT